MTDREKLDKFLEELSKLSNKYGFVIGGCGCCGSPWVSKIDGKIFIEELEFENNKYTGYLGGYKI